MSKKAYVKIPAINVDAPSWAMFERWCETQEKGAISVSEGLRRALCGVLSNDLGDKYINSEGLLPRDLFATPRMGRPKKIVPEES